LEAAQQKQQAYYNQNRPTLTFEPNQLVLLSTKKMPKNRGRKLLPKWMGPFVVQRMIGVQLLLINSIYRKQCVVTMCSMSRIIPKSEGEEPNIEIRKNKKSSLSFEYKVK
jgi:hypothetical protein